MSLLDTASLIVTPNGYKEGKLYSVIPSDGSGDLSVTRATTATRVNSAGLVELVPYNLITYSEQFDNAAWTKARGSVTANATTAPDGTTTADKFVPDTQVNPHFIYQSASNLSTGERYTSSVYAKISEWNSVAIFRINSSVGVSFRLDTQTATVLVGSPVSYSITSVGNGWYRLNVCFAAGSASDGVQIRIGNNSSYGIAGNNSNGLFLWGAQLVEGSVAKPYQKTETRLNIPRLDYSNGTCPSILVEPQRTNLNLYSEDLSNAWYNKFNSSISTNSTTAPNGINTADKITENTSNSYHYVETVNVLTAGSTYTLSAYLKKAERDFGYIGVYTFESKQIRVNLTNGTIESTVGTWINTDIEDAGNGWYRVIGTFSAFLTSYVFAGPALNGTTPIYTGTTGSGIYLWGAQLEAGSYATSYIPTTSASVTRNADVISKTGISSLIGQTEGTIFLDANISVRDTTRVLLDVQDGTNNDTFQFILGGNTLALNIYDSGVLQASLNGGYCLGNKKIALGYKANDFVLYIDGVQVATDTSGSVPTTSLIALGYLYIASGYELGDSINSAALWKTRLTNDQLSTLTTL